MYISFNCASDASLCHVKHSLQDNLYGSLSHTHTPRIIGTRQLMNPRPPRPQIHMHTRAITGGGKRQAESLAQTTRSAVIANLGKMDIGKSKAFPLGLTLTGGILPPPSPPTYPQKTHQIQRQFSLISSPPNISSVISRQIFRNQGWKGMEGRGVKITRLSRAKDLTRFCRIFFFFFFCVANS